MSNEDFRVDLIGDWLSLGLISGTVGGRLFTVAWSSSQKPGALTGAATFEGTIVFVCNSFISSSSKSKTDFFGGSITVGGACWAVMRGVFFTREATTDSALAAGRTGAGFSSSSSVDSSFKPSQSLSLLESVGGFAEENISNDRFGSRPVRNDDRTFAFGRFCAGAVDGRVSLSSKLFSIREGWTLLTRDEDCSHLTLFFVFAVSPRLDACGGEPEVENDHQWV